jgi:VHL beta domain
MVLWKMAASGLVALALPGLASAACAPGNLVSTDTGEVRRVTFVNRSATDTLHLIWIGFDGTATPYAEVPPGMEAVQPTFRGHVWAVEGADGTCKALVVVESDMDVGVR